MGINRYLVRFFLLSAMLLAGEIVFAQPVIKKSTKTEVINGKKFYIHKIEKGETLYSIGKTYDVTGNEIVVENPDLIDGLKPGQFIRIPVKEEVKKDPFFFKGPYHVVKKGDTMYSLSKFYNITTDELIKLNPELKDAGLKLGQILRLPDNTPNAQKAFPPAVNDSVAAVQNDTLKDITDLRVAFLLPFFTSLNTDDKDYKDENNRSTICPKSQIGVSFYEGAMVAVDSLRKQGFSATIYNYDSENDSLILESIIKKPELKEMDLIIGPLYTSNFKRVADFAKKNKIPLVSPFSQVNKILLGNPYIYKATAAVSTQIEELASFIADSGKGKTIVILTPDNFREKSMSDYFKKKYYSLVKDSLKEISIKKSGTGAIDNLLSQGKDVWLVALSNDQVFVTDIVNKLYGLREEKMKLFGLESWSGFESLDPEYLMKLHTSISVPQHIDFESEAVKQFIRLYRLKYHTDPDKFAFHAFDVTYYFLKRLKEEGRTFAEKDPVKWQGIQTGFNFVKTAIESGYENKYTNILEYKDYRQKKIN